MRRSHLLLPALLLLLVTLAACSGNQPSVSEGNASPLLEQRLSTWMADSDMQRNPEGWMIDFRKSPKWEYTHGLMMTALEKVWDETSEQRYFEYMKEFADFMIDENGVIKTYDQSLYNIDRVNPGKFLIRLYQETGEEKYRLAIEQLRDQMRDHPRTSEGGFWHKQVYPHQMWLDGLYMGTPFLARYARAFDEPALYDDVAKQFELINQYTWHEENKVFYHGWDESREQSWSDPETGLSPNAWGRAMGWLAMAVVDVLEYLPEDHAGRPHLLQVAENMADAIVTHRDPETGVWWQVVDQGGREGNYRESSASSMFTYFLLKASQQGVIAKRYREVGLDAYESLVDEFIRQNDDGTISITNVCAVAGLGGDPYRDGTYEYYISEPRRADDPKAVGPFIMASLLYEGMKQ